MQIGLVVLVGLACKNAILIVEYAKQLHQEGRSVFEATQEASRLRLRPILMTSFAFIFGVVPLVVASGAGAEMRRSLGTAVFSGMLGVTLFGIFLTPVFFYVIQGFDETRLFAGAGVRRVVSCAVGGCLGPAIGCLLGKLGVVLLPWGPLVGGVSGRPACWASSRSAPDQAVTNPRSRARPETGRVRQRRRPNPPSHLGRSPPSGDSIKGGLQS